MQLKLLKKILAQPTAPFCEIYVRSVVEEELQKTACPYFRDAFGNLVLGVSSEKSYRQLLSRRSKEPVRVFIAHMDHPGFHGKKWLTPKKLQVDWLGGTPTRYLNGARLWASAKGETFEGKLTKPVLRRGGGALLKSEVQFDSSECFSLSRDATKVFGAFRFRAPVWQKGDTLYTKAADDLVGVFAIVTLAQKYARKNESFIGLLTRAEEVGFIGAIAHFRQGFLSSAVRKVICVSLETSRTLDRAIVGKGPIVRLGDRAGIFHPLYTEVLENVAKKGLKGKYQKRIMDGGRCEASAAKVFGLNAIGISIPLGNYHNQSFEGGPDSRGTRGPAPEFVSLKDIKGLLQITEGLMATNLSWEDPWSESRKGYLSDFQSLRKYFYLDENNLRT